MPSVDELTAIGPYCTRVFFESACREIHGELYTPAPVAREHKALAENVWSLNGGMMALDMKAIKDELRGPVALVMAPFHDDLRLNVTALRSNLKFLVDAGVRTGNGFAIAPCGTGEYLSLSDEEQDRKSTRLNSSHW